MINDNNLRGREEIHERATYPSDITHKQFEIIRPTLETARKTTPHTIDLYDIFCAARYQKREDYR